MDRKLIARYSEETVSNSGLAALSVSPRVYRNYKDKVEQATESYFNLGSATHCKVLEYKEFDDRYVVSKHKPPGGMYAIFIDVLFRTRCRKGEYKLLKKAEWIKTAHAEAGFKLKIQTVQDKFENDDAMQSYYNELVENEGKITLSPNDDNAIEACIKGIQDHTKAQELLYGYILSDCRNELEVVWEHPDHPWFMMKSIFDRVIIDEATKTIILVDLKTTSKPVSSFIQSYRKFKYHRQMGLYEMGLKWYLQNEFTCADGSKPNADEWKFEVYIVATQTNGYGDTAVYTPSKGDLVKGLEDADKLLTRMAWHFDHNLWDHPMEYYTNDGVLTLNLDEE